MVTRQTIGQAMGLVMERYQIDEDAAFRFLVRVSLTSNIKLRDVAQEVVNSSNDRYRHSQETDPKRTPGVDSP